MFSIPLIPRVHWVANGVHSQQQESRNRENQEFRSWELPEQSNLKSAPEQKHSRRCQQAHLHSKCYCSKSADVSHRVGHGGEPENLTAGIHRHGHNHPRHEQGLHIHHVRGHHADNQQLDFLTINALAGYLTFGVAVSGQNSGPNINGSVQLLTFELGQQASTESVQHSVSLVVILLRKPGVTNPWNNLRTSKTFASPIRMVKINFGLVEQEGGMKIKPPPCMWSLGQAWSPPSSLAGPTHPYQEEVASQGTRHPAGQDNRCLRTGKQQS